jgi:hypothetical protein
MAKTQQSKDLEDRLGALAKERKYEAKGKETKEKNARMGATSSYEVQIYNETSTTIPLIRTVYKANDSDEIFQSDAKNVGPNNMADFKLTDCNKLFGYIVGFFNANGQLVGKFPEQGVMNSQRMSQENPKDTDPCVDWISIGNA